MRKLYYQIPMPIKRLAFSLIPYRYIAGKAYRDTLNLCKYLENADASEVKAFQEKKLQEILTYAVNKVPFYKPYKSKVENAVSYRDVLNHFPVISKKTVQDNFSEFISEDINSIRYLKARTGGSSGNQLMFYQDCNMYSVEMAFIHSLWAKSGYTPACRKATFRGVTFNNLKPGVFWQYNPIHNELQFSPFHMSENNLPLYVRRLQQYKPEFIHGYPSALSILAEYITANSLQDMLPAVKAIFCSSEACSQYQRQKLEKTFRSRVYSWYGHSERVILAGETAESSAFYYAQPGYGICELINSDGDNCQTGEQGEITGTGFWNRSMPLIRYNTEDKACAIEVPSPEKSFAVHFNNVESRWKSGVTGKAGNWISAAALNVHEDVFEHVTAYQYYQAKPGILEILVVPGKNWSDQDKLKILDLHNKKTWNQLDITVTVTDYIPRTSGGKLLPLRLGYTPEKRYE